MTNVSLSDLFIGKGLFMRNVMFAVTIILGLVSAAAPAKAQSARAVLQDQGGSQIGVIDFTQTDQGVRVDVRVEGLEPGVYGLHIHENAECAAPDFESAGGHFNPTGSEHGFLNSNGPHAGDLPNLQVDQEGRAWMEFVTARVSLDPGENDSLLQGMSVVIHAGADDYITDPSGNAGERVACGLVEELNPEEGG